METMRRRLLFIFSWLAAAALTSVVASAAVAIAGGQVNDRPLRPLTSAEVEALAAQPIPRPITTLAPEPTVTAFFIIPNDVDEIDPSEFDPKSPDGIAQPFTGIDAEDTEGAGPETVTVETRAEIVDLEGGTASIGGQDGQVLLLWALPRPGYVVEQRFEDNALTVIFTNDRQQSWLVANWVTDEGIVVETFDGPV
jgi:hypothetical protein